MFIQKRATFEEIDNYFSVNVPGISTPGHTKTATDAEGTVARLEGAALEFSLGDSFNKEQHVFFRSDKYENVQVERISKPPISSYRLTHLFISASPVLKPAQVHKLFSGQ